MSLLKKILITHYYVLVGTIHRFGSIVLVTPLILVNYDLVEQSFWWLIGNIIGFALLADSGFGSALVRAVSYFRAARIQASAERGRI